MRAVAMMMAVSLCLLAGCGGGGGGGSDQPAITISVTPSSASLDPAATQAFTATVTNTTNTAVTWTVQEGATGGTITNAGVYTAPATTGTYHVVATSQANTSKKATAVVTVAAHVAISISPTTVSTSQGQSVAFTATVTGTTNTAVTWAVQEGAAGGTVTSEGVYTPIALSGTFHVVATSQADPSQRATATVTVQAGSASGTIN